MSSWMLHPHPGLVPFFPWAYVLLLVPAAVAVYGLYTAYQHRDQGNTRAYWAPALGGFVCMILTGWLWWTLRFVEIIVTNPPPPSPFGH